MENNKKQNNESINKMDKLILKLQEYKDNTEDNTPKTNIVQNDNNNPENAPQIMCLNVNTKSCIIPESPEYYENEINKFLNDICNEKEKRINLFNKILNLSITVNIILLAYILGIQYYDSS